MKKLSVLCFALLLCLTAVLSSCGATQSTVPSGMLDATAEGVTAYSFYVPQTWTADAIGVMSMAHHLTDTDCGISVSEFSLGEGESDAGTYWENLKTEYADTLSGFTVISEGNGLLNGKTAGIYAFSANVGGTEVCYQQVIAVVGLKAYVLTYSAPTERYESHLEDFGSVQTEFVFHR